jgi:predicted Zn-dependent protease
VILEYENPEVPDEVNLPQSHPLVDFLWMLLAVGGATAAVILLLALLTDFFVSYVPFELEQRLVTSFDLLEEGLQEGQKREVDPTHREIQTYLQSLTYSLLKQAPLPEGMAVTVHYRNDELVNAFATLAGNVIIHKGLLSKLQSENALSMVLAHEIEHIRSRHPIRALGRGIIISLVLLNITGFSDTTVVETMVSSIGFISTLSFSRDHEMASDEAALKLLKRHYGHVAGASQLFEVLDAEGQSAEFTDFLSTHPLNKDRIDAVNLFITSDLTTNAVLSPLPDFLREAF